MNDDQEQLDGFVSKIHVNGKTYGLQCYVVAVHAIKCPNCGHSFELAYGKGRCEFCGTYFTTQFQITEANPS